MSVINIKLLSFTDGKEDTKYNLFSDSQTEMLDMKTLEAMAQAIADNTGMMVDVTGYIPSPFSVSPSWDKESE